MSTPLSGAADVRRDKRNENRNRFIYLAQAIDLNNDPEVMEAARLAVHRTSEFLQLPVFNPKGAWDMSVLDCGPGGDPGRDALVGANQTLALAADLLIAVIDLKVPSWGMPFEVLARAQRADRPILVCCKQDPREWPLYLQWVRGGNATWLGVGAMWECSSSHVDAALERLGLQEVLST